jgi:hypothetical protein
MSHNTSGAIELLKTSPDVQETSSKSSRKARDNPNSSALEKLLVSWSMGRSRHAGFSQEIGNSWHDLIRKVEELSCSKQFSEGSLPSITPTVSTNSADGASETNSTTIGGLVVDPGANASRVHRVPATLLEASVRISVGMGHSIALRLSSLGSSTTRAVAPSPSRDHAQRHSSTLAKLDP